MALGALIVLLFCFFGTVGYFWYQLRIAMHRNLKITDETPETYHLLYQSVTFQTSDGLRLSGWYIPTEKPQAVVILIHGRHKKGKSLMLRHALYLYENNYSTFLFDMRGYGDSEGKTCGFGEREWQDAVGAYDYIKSLPENKHIKVGFFGISLGAVVAILAAGKAKVGDFIIASVPFASHASLFAKQIEKSPFFPKFFFRFALQLAAFLTFGVVYYTANALFVIHNITSPIFLIGATHDEEVNSQDAWKLFEKAQKPKEYWEAKTKHDVFAEEKEEFQSRMLRFLQLYS